MGTPYGKIYDNVLAKFRSWEIPLMSEEEVKECLHDYLVPAITKFHVCRKNLKNRSDVTESFNEDLSETEIEILSNYMLIEYLDSTYIRTPTLLKSSLSSTDFNSFSSANMLDKLMAMHKAYLAENDTLLSRYAWLTYKESGVRLSIGYDKKDYKQDSSYENNNSYRGDGSSNVDVPNVEVGSTIPGKPFSEPEVIDSHDGDDVVLDFVLPTLPEFEVAQVNTVDSHEKASVVFAKNEEEGAVEVAFNIPRGADGDDAEHTPIDNSKIDVMF